MNALKFVKKNPLISGVLICAVAVGISASPAKAGNDPVQEAIDRVEAVTNLLIGVIGGFTNAVITPMGLSAAARIFRHVVIANV